MSARCPHCHAAWPPCPGVARHGLHASFQGSNHSIARHCRQHKSFVVLVQVLHASMAQDYMLVNASNRADAAKSAMRIQRFPWPWDV